MLVAHALWLVDGGLAIWAEDSTGASEPPRTSEHPRRPHPFAADHGTLRDVLAGLPAKAVTGSRLVWLPAIGTVPVPSPEFVAEPPADESVTLREFEVPTLEYEADEAPGVLRELADTATILGASARHLREVVAFATDLVARGRLLPTVDTSGPRAVWRPILTGADAQWARSLALALPPVSRAAAPRQSGAAVLAAALDTLVDVVARAHLDRTPLTPPEPCTVVDAWLRALTGPDRSFTAPAAEAAHLATGLATWQRDAVGGAVRACFRLVEPDDGDDWRLVFALQDADEPSLVVEADQIWRGRHRALARRLDSPQETLLTELGRASRLWPELQAALRTSHPEAMVLDVEGAHRFLADGAPRLAAAGFGVLLPSWWTSPRARLGVKVSASPAQPGKIDGTPSVGQQALVQFEWRLALGDTPLTAEELAELTALRAPLVRLRGQWVPVDPTQLAAGLKLLTAGDRGELTVADLLRWEAGEDSPTGLPVTDVAARGWLADLLSSDIEHRLRPASEPAGFHGVLRPYQRRGLAWLQFLQRVGFGAVLADDMGLGKTATTLALIADDPPEAGPTLIICPMSLVGNWQREAARFTPDLPVHVHHGVRRARGSEFTASIAGARLVITTYSLAARDVDVLADVSWHRIVVDEAQAIKNAATRQATAVRSLPARHRIAVTGTPVENRLADLWSLMEFANPGLLGPAATFKKRYAEPVERYGDDAVAARLRRLTQPFILRRLKTDRSIISDLPQKLEMEVVCNLTAEQATLYQAIVDDMLAQIDSRDGMARRGLVLATMTKLKQVCNHPAHLLRDGGPLAGRSGKVARLEEILEEVLAGGERALLFTQYAEFGAMLRAHLAARFGREVAYLHGGVGKAARDAMVARFQSESPDAPPLFILSLRAGGAGLTLTAANHVIHVDRWWNPAVEDQATDRAFRIGQRRQVQVRKLVCAGTLEEKISRLIQDKRRLAARIVGTGEGWLTELSTDELRRLFTLEEGAVVE